MAEDRIERDSMGEVRVPAEALYGAQTQRAVENFQISGLRFSRGFIRALGLLKAAAARVNCELKLLDERRSDAIEKAAQEVAQGDWDDQFPIDIFQTGSGTSTNMNANEVIAHRAIQIAGESFDSKFIHPNDHVNLGQSSNDVIPTVIHVSAALELRVQLLPALNHLKETIAKKGDGLRDVVKTGRTHLMDAMPIRLDQEMSGWAFQVDQAVLRISNCLTRLAKLAIGGTAVGTGVNTHPDFGRQMARHLGGKTGIKFTETDNHFAAQSSMDTATELSGHLKTAASALMKIANDLRWMNSGPIAGLGEIALPALQPGSSIMPGKVNPVICEATMMACAQVMGNDVAITLCNSHGNFELNTMLPLIAHNLLESIQLLANASRSLADQAIAGFTVDRERIASLLNKNPILVTALNPVIGYDKAAAIAKRAYAENRSLKDVAAEMTELKMEELERILDPGKLTEGGNP